MKVSRRSLLASAAASSVVSYAAGAAGAKAKASGASAPSPTALPAKSLFARMPYAYLDSGSTHPLSLGARAALDEYARYKTRDGSLPDYDMDEKEKAVLNGFATLVGADPSELSFVQSTTLGENLVLQALGLPAAGGRVVTDALHFFGSFYTYRELGNAGMDVVTLRLKDEGRIDLEEMAGAINSKTKLVAVSLVSTFNGFEYDLRKICEMAHAHGAYVYADIVHAAGAVPTNLHASGVDFAACSSYKWLMGDFGLGFLYVRKDLQDRVRRPWWGYHQLGAFKTHVYPHDEPGDTVADYAATPDAAGHFAMGTFSWTGLVLLAYSLEWINRVGVAAIQGWRQPLVDAVQTELRRRGYEPLTPIGTQTPLVAFALKDARSKLSEPLKKGNVRITVSTNRFRPSISVFNDMNDIDRLLETLPKKPP